MYVQTGMPISWDMNPLPEEISPKCVSYKTPDLCRLFASYQMYEKKKPVAD